jgi:hypothetical protein
MLPASGPSAGVAAHVPQVVSLATLAMEAALRWLDATALLDGCRPALLSQRLEALVEDVVATVGVVLREQRDGLLDDLLAAAAEQTDRHGCPECVDAIADALHEAIAV